MVVTAAISKTQHSAIGIANFGRGMLVGQYDSPCFRFSHPLTSSGKIHLYFTEYPKRNEYHAIRAVTSTIVMGSYFENDTSFGHQ
ncbi:hypothetical protein CEXT_481331 [Caerostris extrusa]|uniref:Uncharacterized protein n=1 Tax=Caerostris extrusa TaxID=172846 RepID=A0AAV4R4T7_CAEEX|nr:hypothetical protein CEXT_481331 [Caerostris extrusa]